MFENWNEIYISLCVWEFFNVGSVGFFNYFYMEWRLYIIIIVMNIINFRSDEIYIYCIMICEMVVV